MSPAKKPAKKTAGRSKTTGSRSAKTPARRSATTKKTTATKTPVRKTTAKKTAVKKTSAKKTVAKKTAARKAAPKKTTTKKSVAKKTAAPKKTAAKKAAPRKTAAKKPVARKTAAPKKTAARPAAPKKTTAAKPPSRPQPARAGTPAARPPRPAKLDSKQLAAIRERLLQERAELVRQQTELDAEGTQGESLAEAGLDDDFADAGTATFDRERDLSIRNNITDLIDQITRAVARIDEGTYGTCERCGRPIDAARLKALPHALLCLDCKRREERGR